MVGDIVYRLELLSTPWRRQCHDNYEFSTSADITHADMNIGMSFIKLHFCLSDVFPNYIKIDIVDHSLLLTSIYFSIASAVKVWLSVGMHVSLSDTSFRQLHLPL